MTIAQSLILTALVFLAEHWLLTRRYGTRSSLQKLFAFSPAARTDLSYMVLYGPVLWWVPRLPWLLCGPGLLYVLAGWALSDLGWSGAMAYVASPGPVASFLLMLLLADLTLYWTHRMFHAVPVLWRIHRLHHAAPEMNIANGGRIALSEHFVNELAILLAYFAVFGPDRPGVAVAVLVVRSVIDKLQHSELPWDYGVLGKVFVSPRFHRLHHSADRRDYDSHFADILVIWDYLFGTVSQRYRLSSAVASECPIGLPDDPEHAQLNRGALALFHATFPAQAAELWKRFAARRAPSIG